MKFRIATDSSLAAQLFDGQRCQFGITEAIGAGLSAFGGANLLGGLGSLLGIGEAAAAPAAAGTSIADLVGTGTGLFGGTDALAGTALAGGAGTDLAALTATPGLGAASTALDFLAAPGASAFNAAAITPGLDAAAVGGGPGILGSASPLSQPVPSGGTSVFDTGTSAVPGVSSTGAPAPATVSPAGASAASVAAPPGVAGAPDATSSFLNANASADPAFTNGTAPIAGSPGAAPSPSIASLTGAPAPNGAVPGAVGYSSLGGPSGPALLGGGSSVSDSSSIDSILGKFSPSNLASSSIDSLTKNPLGVGLGAAGLGYSIYEGTQQTANEKALTNQATQANQNSTALEQQGQGLVNYLTNGTLPPAYQTQITQSINSAIANAKSNAAAQGLSTDPTQNTALAAQIAEIQNQQPILQEQIAAQLAGTGTSLINAGASAAGLSGSLYQALVQNDTTQAANAGKAIATLAAALNGKTNTNIGSTSS